MCIRDSSGVGVEVVGQAPVWGASGHDQPGQGRGHHGTVGEPPERAVVGGRGELGPRRQPGSSLVYVGGGAVSYTHLDVYKRQVHEVGNVSRPSGGNNGHAVQVQPVSIGHTSRLEPTGHSCDQDLI